MISTNKLLRHSHLLHHHATASQVLGEIVVLLLHSLERLLQLLDMINLAGPLALLLLAFRTDDLCLVAHLRAHAAVDAANASVLAVVHHGGLVLEHLLLGGAVLLQGLEFLDFGAQLRDEHD